MAGIESGAEPGVTTPAEGSGAVVWVVTARYRHSLAAGDVPWGVMHAKRIGDGYTACRQPATIWPTFWTLPFRPGLPSTCPQCSAAVTAQVPE